MKRSVGLKRNTASRRSGLQIHQSSEALVAVSQCMYQKALDHLEWLFVQQLLKLTKLGMNGVGMNLYPFFGLNL